MRAPTPLRLGRSGTLDEPRELLEGGPILPRSRFIATMALAVVSHACNAPEPEPTAEEISTESETAQTSPNNAPHAGVITVVAEDYSFTAPPTFPSGWVKLRFDNRGRETHFLVLHKLPQGRSFDNFTAQVSAPFDDLYARYRAGQLEQTELFEQLGAALPEWFLTERRVAGGPGFTAPDTVSETLVHLEPGDYVMECYVRAMTESDTFHGSHGMLRPLIVTEEVSPLAEPQADFTLTLSNYEIGVGGELAPGENVVRVTVAEDPEGLILHNVHLARLSDGTDSGNVAAWLDWVDHMLPPAPATFLGGAGQMSAGGTSYVTLNVEPGRYAWVSEAYGVRGMVHELTVE